MLKLNSVVKKYDGFELNCSLEVPRGCVTGLIGKNGAGKSTVFKTILGLIRYDGGDVTVFGKKPSELEPADRERMGVVMAESGFTGYLSIRDLLPVLESMYHSFDRKKFVEKCRRFELPLDKNLKEFSTGMKRKFHVLVAMSHDAEFLLLDEPTAGLDVIARDELLELLRDYMEKEDGSVLISSHISADLEGLCDDIYLIDQGKIILHEETDILLSDYALLKVSEEQFQTLDHNYVLRYRKEPYGYSCLTNQKQFYMENYPQIVLEKCGIDDVILMMDRGNIL